MADDIQTPDATTTTATPSPDTSAGETVDTLKAKLAAADRKITQLSTKIPTFEKLLADKEFAIGEKDSVLKETTGKVQTYEQQIAKMQADLVTAQNAAATASKMVERTSLLASKYPDLMPYEAEGLLDKSLSGDELTTWLDKFHAKVSGDRKSAVETTLLGSSPTSPPPKGDGTVTVAVIEKQIEEAYEKRDFALGLKLSMERAGMVK